LSVTAVDSDANTASIAHRACATRPEIHVLRADAFSLPFAARSFDVVTASMFLHHFDHRDVVRLLRRFVRLARRAVLINDLRRDWLPWGFIYVVARVTRRHPMFVHDAPLSVLRGFTAAELLLAAHDAGAEGARVRCGWPYRVSMTLSGSGS
jgi:ubiquinone/menaquinone biosynthesis C-methylase UbiE